MLSEAIAKLDDKKYEEAKALLEALVNESPDNPEINFYCGAVNDSMGLEQMAIPYYRQALENEIEGDLREAAYIQLGSSFRCIGEYEFAREVFSKGLEEYPANPAMKVFYAMTLYNMGDHKESFTLMLKTLVSDSSHEWIKKYERALNFYSEDIDGVWK
jgi:tetratricopeptide (TPR) repeat protein